jgi:fatty acid-binding protein DegV
MLNIKPICGEKEGEIVMLEKARGYGKAVKRLIEIIKENTPDIENRTVGISHTKCYEKAAAFKDELIKALHLKEKSVIITEAHGLVASYANKGGFVVAV